jgi:hypothetical protein
MIITIEAGTLFENNRFSISPIMDINDFRVILDWGEKPQDLDAHFEKHDAYHISHRNNRVLADGEGRLDRDDLDSFGPETITVKKITSESTYRYYVHDFTNSAEPTSKQLSKSRASVKVYGEGRLLNVFNIPRGVRGVYWNVFAIKNGRVVETNQVVRSLP